MLNRIDRSEAERLALSHGGKLVFQLLIILILLILAFLVDLQEALEFGDATSRTEDVIGSALAARADIDSGLVEDGRLHLRSDETHPNKAVELQFVFGQVFL